MARSIHVTRKTLRRLAAEALEDKEAAAGRHEKAWKAKRRKRFLKKSVHAERRRPAAPLAGTPIAAIPIEVVDESRDVTYGASPEDLLNILSLLPDGSREGISRVQLLLGKARQEEFVVRERVEHECDPLTGRPGRELFPGVYTGCVLGTYFTRSGLIALYGFVVSRGIVPLPLPALELYLKLHALKTFVHEIAHHHDKAKRVRRGRWLADRKENLENYAERMEERWTKEVLIPYLERAYPQGTEALLGWIEQHGGIRLPLSFLAGDPRRTERNGLTRLVFCSADAFEYWVAKFPSYKGILESRTGFARNLHNADAYEECLVILGNVLLLAPENPDALILQADTFVHLERLEEAAAIIDKVLEKLPTSERALEVRGSILEAKDAWAELVEHCRRSLACIPADSRRRKFVLLREAVAYCGLGDLESMERTMQSLMEMGFMKDRPAPLRNLIFRRAGRARSKGQAGNRVRG